MAGGKGAAGAAAPNKLAQAEPQTEYLDHICTLCGEDLDNREAVARCKCPACGERMYHRTCLDPWRAGRAAQGRKHKDWAYPCARGKGANPFHEPTCESMITATSHMPRWKGTRPAACDIAPQQDQVQARNGIAEEVEEPYSSCNETSSTNETSESVAPSPVVLPDEMALRPMEKGDKDLGSMYSVRDVRAARTGSQHVEPAAAQSALRATPSADDSDTPPEWEEGSTTSSKSSAAKQQPAGQHAQHAAGLPHRKQPMRVQDFKQLYFPEEGSAAGRKSKAAVVALVSKPTPVHAAVKTKLPPPMPKPAAAFLAAATKPAAQAPAQVPPPVQPAAAPVAQNPATAASSARPAVTPMTQVPAKVASAVVHSRAPAAVNGAAPPAAKQPSGTASAGKAQAATSTTVTPSAASPAVGVPPPSMNAAVSSGTAPNASAAKVPSQAPVSIQHPTAEYINLPANLNTAAAMATVASNGVSAPYVPAAGARLFTKPTQVAPSHFQCSTLTQACSTLTQAPPMLKASGGTASMASAVKAPSAPQLLVQANDPIISFNPGDYRSAFASSFQDFWAHPVSGHRQDASALGGPQYVQSVVNSHATATAAYNSHHWDPHRLAQNQSGSVPNKLEQRTGGASVVQQHAGVVAMGCSSNDMFVNELMDLLLA